MELLVLGCDGTYPGAGGATSGYLLGTGYGHALLDCGSGVLSKLMDRMDPAELSAVVLTHWHFDHMADLPVLRYYLMTRGKSLPLYAPLEEGSLSQWVQGPEFEINDIRDGVRFGDIVMTAAPTKHPVPAYALRFQQGDKALVYTGDSAPHDPLIDLSKGADLLIADASCLHRDWHAHFPHMSALQAAELARDAGVKRLLLTHCPPHVDAKSLALEARQAFRQSEIKRYCL